MQKQISLKGEVGMQGNLQMKVTRSAESWQFFAFVFAALYTLEAVLLQAVPWLWLRLLTQTLGFGLTFYATMLNAKARNWLVGMLTRIKELEQYTG